MKKFLMIQCVFCMLLILPSTCYAIHSNIIKNITAYSCDDYKKIMLSTDIENELYNYLGDKRFTVTVHKIITSAEYLKEIKNFIRAEYPPPVYAPENVILAMNNQDKIVIAQEVVFNLKTRTAYISSERLYGFPSQQTILNLKNDAIFPRESYIYDIDNNWEYGRIANAAIDFMESIKDIYFNPEIRRQHEMKEEAQTKFNKCYYYLSKDYTLIFDIKEEVQFYIDLPSFHMTTQGIYEGWIVLKSNKDLKPGAKEGKYYTRVDYFGSKMYIIYEMLTYEKGNETWSEVKTPELWENNKLVDGILLAVGKKFKLQQITSSNNNSKYNLRNL